MEPSSYIRARTRNRTGVPPPKPQKASSTFLTASDEKSSTTTYKPISQRTHNVVKHQPTKRKKKKEHVLCTVCFDIPCICATKKNMRRPIAQIPSLKAPKPMRSTRTSKRKSLSEQLATISTSAGNITATLQEQYGLIEENRPKPILTTPSRYFTVGTLESKFFFTILPSPVHFFCDRVEYQFHHPYEHKVIAMKMFYHDMSKVQLDDTKNILRFKISRTLLQFSRDYDPKHHDHFVSIGFNSQSDCNHLRRKNILKRMR